MLRIGLTGGIGAGKSTAARRLAERGAHLVDADVLAREVVAPGTEGLAAVVDAFGPGVLAVDGTLDRAALARLVFGDEQRRQRLNGLLHPRIARRTAEVVATLPSDGVLVHDVPLLVENAMQARYHLVLVVGASAEARVHRLVTSRGLSEEDARRRVASQATDEQRRAVADVWVDNEGEPQALVDAVDALWDRRLAPFAQNLRHHRRAVPELRLDTLHDPGPAAASGPASDTRADVEARAERLVGRLTAAAGEPAPDVRVTVVGDLVRVDVVVADPARVEPLVPVLADAAGLVPRPGEPALDNADPAAPTLCRVRRSPRA